MNKNFSGYARDFSVALKPNSKYDWKEYFMFREKLPEIFKDFLTYPKTLMKGYVVEKVTSDLTNGASVEHPHNLTEEQLLLVRNAIENPVAIIRDGDAIVVVTDVEDYNNDPIITVLKEDEKKGCNYVASIYGKVNFLNMVAEASRTGNLDYLDADKLRLENLNMLDRMSSMDRDEVSFQTKMIAKVEEIVEKYNKDKETIRDDSIEETKKQLQQLKENMRASIEERQQNKKKPSRGM